MKIKIIDQLDQPDNSVLDIAFDVSGKSLDYASYCNTERDQELWEGQLRNHEGAIVNELEKLKALSAQNGYKQIRVLCEATGVYHRKLLRIARHLGCQTALISGEAVCKSQVIQSNDYNKTDQKDPKTMLLVSQLGKTLRDRGLSGSWLALRQLNLEYERNERDGTRFKNRLKQGLFELFCDLGFKNQWIYESHASATVADLYGFNPYRIMSEGRSRFTQKLRRRKLRPLTIERLWNDAKQSTLMLQDQCIVECLEEDLRQMHAQLRELLGKRLELRSRIVAEVEKIHRQGLIRTNPHEAPIGPFMFSRIIAETGSLLEFRHAEQLWRYGGFNITCKQSGAFKGQDKLSKKGRNRLRRCVQLACIKLVVRGQLYGDYFHAKKSKGMSGNKAMVAVSRKLLKLLHGLEKSGGVYKQERVFKNEVTFKKAA